MEPQTNAMRAVAIVSITVATVLVIIAIGVFIHYKIWKHDAHANFVMDQFARCMSTSSRPNKVAYCHCYSDTLYRSLIDADESTVKSVTGLKTLNAGVAATCAVATGG